MQILLIFKSLSFLKNINLIKGVLQKSTPFLSPMKTKIYDLETIKNCFIAMFINFNDPKQVEIFEISEFKNDSEKYYNFLKQCIIDKITLVSFNGLKFDAQINTHFLKNYSSLKRLSGIELAAWIYEYAQLTITRSKAKEFHDYHGKTIPTKECDLLAINNYDNPQKMASLKWLQFNMDWYNIMDMNVAHDKPIKKHERQTLIQYCYNDCLSTRELFKRNLGEVNLRIQLSNTFKMNLLSHSEPKLSKTLFSYYLCEELGISSYELSKQRTYRSKIYLSEAILKYISFKTPVFQNTYNKFYNLTLDGENLKGSFAHECTYRGLPLSFALGGLHGAKSGIYESDENYIIKSLDVKSYYPNLAIRNEWAPAHINKKIFCERYESFYEERKKYSKKNPLNYVYKIILNAAYGLSNEKNSFLKDSFFTMQITVNGQLLLCMLMEQLCENIPCARPIMVNTDGIEIIIPKEYEQKYYDICKEWEALTQLELEFEDYHKLIIPDVNNYLGIFADKKISKEEYDKLNREYPKPILTQKEGEYFMKPVKTKGRFEIDKPLHKNKSYRIKRIAFYNFFAHNMSVEESLKENKNIFDFSAGSRVVGSWKFKQSCVQAGDAINEDCQKTLRYYMANKGCKIIKTQKQISGKYKVIKLGANNHYENIIIKIDKNKPFIDYDIDYAFYRKLINKEINNISPQQEQQTLF